MFIAKRIIKANKMEGVSSFEYKEFETGRLLLRQLRNSDAVTISALRSDDEVNAYIDRPKELGPDNALAFIEKMREKVNSKQCFYWAVCLKGEKELAGTVCLFNFSHENTCAELGYELNPDYQGKGIADEAVKQVISFAFKEAGFKKLEACIHRFNIKSVKLAERNNFIVDTSHRDEKPEDYVFYVLNA